MPGPRTAEPGSSTAPVPALAPVPGQASDQAAAGWRLGFRSLETEHPEEVALEILGTLPADLGGTLYRVGPARHDVYGERYRHWFDGDGMVHALRLDRGRATLRSRFVATDKKREEDMARRRIFGTFGTPPAGGPIARAHRGRPKSAANTNVVFHAGRLLALWEAGLPWELDPVTLETIGESDLDGALEHGAAYSAHPKYDRFTGEMWNFGVGYGPKPTISLYRTSADGTTSSMARLALSPAAMVHDFSLTATKVVLVIVPIALPRVPVALLSGRRSFEESLRWEPERGTEIWVYDRASGDLRVQRTEPFMMFHTVNAWDDGAEVVLDLCSYPDATIMRLFTEVMVGRSLPGAWPRVERLRIGQTGVRRQRLSDMPMEFPRVAGRSLGGEHTRIYGVSQHEEDEFLGVPACVDLVTGETVLASLRAGQFAGEPVPVTKANAPSDEDVWLLSLVLDADAGQSALWVLDGTDVSAPPVAVVPLPHLVPFGFHGNWVRQEVPVPG
ncbi:MAG: carotenoid oxygenase family protein [Acidimicrobiales bacterium]